MIKVKAKALMALLIAGGTMNATKLIMKSVTTLATMGVILAGCSGGNDPVNRTPNPNQNQNTFQNPNPYNPGMGGGSGTVGVSGNEAIDDVNTKLDALNTKLDQTLDQASQANGNAKSSKKKANIAMWAALGIAGAMVLERGVKAVDAFGTAEGDLGKAAGAFIGNDNTLYQREQMEKTVTTPVNANVDRQSEITDSHMAQGFDDNQAGIDATYDQTRFARIDIAGTSMLHIAQLAAAKQELDAKIAAVKSETHIINSRTEATQKEITNPETGLAALKKLQDQTSSTLTDVQTAQKDQATKKDQTELNTLVTSIKTSFDAQAKIIEALDNAIPTLATKQEQDAANLKLTAAIDSYKAQVEKFAELVGKDSEAVKELTAKLEAKQSQPTQSPITINLPGTAAPRSEAEQMTVTPAATPAPAGENKDQLTAK
jgi:hypothetical protein